MPADLSPSTARESTPRHSPHPIEPLFLKRWSPRAFKPRRMPPSDLQTILEAARWAPSAHNIQPWHFVFSHREDQYWAQHLALLHPFNAGWAKNASVLLFLISQAVIPADNNAPARPSRTHSFDAGAAWAHLALQAAALGYQAHAMAGIDYDRASEALDIPGTLRLEIAVAIGLQTSANQLPPSLQERERPSDRRPLEDMMSAGVFQSSRTHELGAAT